MPLILSLAMPEDAARIAEIHIAAFGSNSMLRAQFPTPATRSALQESIEMKALTDILDPQMSVLVVRDLDDGSNDLDLKRELEEVTILDERAGRIISFSKWNHPVTKDQQYAEAPWVWPKGTNIEVLEGWTNKTERALESLLEQTPYFRE
jgi:hypothetical protein